MTTIHDAEIELRFDSGVPSVLVRGAQTWTVIDMPTPLGVPDEARFSPLVTHPPATWVGWRFTARADDGDVLVFDVRQRGAAWDLIRTYR